MFARLQRTMFCFCALFVTSLSLAVVSQAHAADHHDINVRDFGAQGDGVTDDTAAIQAAFVAAQSRGVREMVGLYPQGIHDQPPIIGVGEATEVPSVYFPAGRYRVTRTLVPGHLSVTLGQSGAVIVMEDPTKDVFYFHNAFRVVVQGLTFEGGKNQLLFSTRNNESARVIVRDCHFIGASVAGIDCNSHLRPGGTDYRTKPLPAYELVWQDGTPILTPNDLEGKDSFNNSTLFSCTASTFKDCAAALNVGADGVVLRDCHVEARVGDSEPVFHFGKSYRGQVYLINVKAVAPEGASATSDRVWIDNSATQLIVRESEFSGQPMTLIRHRWYKPTNVPRQVIVTDTLANVGDAAKPYVLWIDNEPTENTPYLIDISRVTNTASRRGHALGWSVRPDRTRLADAVHVDQPALDAYGARLIPWPYRVLVHDNTHLTAAIAPALSAKRSAPESDDLRHAMRVGPVDITPAEPSQTLLATDYGVTAAEGTDDTQAMRALLAAAAKNPGITRILMPAARVSISDSLDLPGRVILTSSGQGWIIQRTPERPIFKGEKTQYLQVERMTFSGGGIGFDLQPVAEAQISFDICGFYDMSFMGIRLRAGEGNDARFRVRDSTFMTVKRLVDSDVRHAEIGSVWVTGHGQMDDMAAITNRHGGSMLVRHLLAVPGLMRFHNPPHLPWVNDWPYGDHLRWVDNFGRLELQDNRFGGEWMGFCLAYNRDPRATLYLDGGVSCAFSEWSRQYFVHNEFRPQALVIRNVGWAMVFPNGGVWSAPPHQEHPEENIHVINVAYENFAP